MFACEIASLPYVERPENLVKLCLQDIPATRTTILTPDVLVPLNDFTHLRALALCFREGDITNLHTHLKTQPIGSANVEDRVKAITSHMQSIEEFLPTLVHKQLEALKLHVLSGVHFAGELQGLIEQNLDHQ